MSATQPSPPVAMQPTEVRPRNGMATASLVIGVASLVAAVSFILFPLALIASIVGLILGVIALSRGHARGVTNTGQATAGVICCGIALVISITLAVRVGTWAARNTGVFTRFDKCIAQANNRSEVSTCIARFANEVRP
jgi:hypothetical protein